jgi:hypothetical protein
MIPPVFRAFVPTASSLGVLGFLAVGRMVGAPLLGAGVAGKFTLELLGAGVGTGVPAMGVGLGIGVPGVPDMGE